MKTVILLFVYVVCTSQYSIAEDLGTIWAKQTYPATGLQFSPDDKYILVQGYPSNTEVIETESGNTLFTKNYMAYPVWMKDGKHFIALQANPNGKFFVIVETGTWITIDSFPGSGDNFSLSPDEHTIASATYANILAFYDLVNRTKIKEVRYFNGSNYPKPEFFPTIGAMVWSGDNQHLIYTAHDGTVCFWDVANDSISYKYNGGGGGSNILVISDDRSKIAFKTSKQGVALQIMDMATKQIITEIKGTALNITGISFSADNKFLAVGWGGGYNLQIYKIPSGELLWERKIETSFENADFSQDGKYLASGAGNTLFLFNISSVTSVAEMVDSAIDSYPNPVISKLSVGIKVPYPMNIPTTIIDHRGGIVKQLLLRADHDGINSWQLDVEDLPTGSYTILLRTNTVSRSVRFIKL